MEKMMCDVCRGTLMVDAGGQTATCVDCGIKYSVERLREKALQLRSWMPGEQQLSASGDPTIQNLLIRANEFWATGDTETAQSYFNRILDLDPNNADARKAIADLGVKVGERYFATVTRILPFGCFVQMKPSRREGLVHISKLSKDKVDSVDECVSIGQEVIVLVMEIDEKNRINLSMKDA